MSKLFTHADNSKAQFYFNSILCFCKSKTMATERCVDPKTCRFGGISKIPWNFSVILLRFLLDVLEI